MPTPGIPHSYIKEAAATHFRLVQSSEGTETTPITSRNLEVWFAYQAFGVKSTSLKYQVKEYSFEVSN